MYIFKGFITKALEYKTGLNIKFKCVCIATYVRMCSLVMSLRLHVYMVPLNYNFILTHMIMHGTTRILHCVPVTCLHGPCLLIACNVHVSWKYMHRSTRMNGSTRVHSHVKKFYSLSLEHYIN